MISFTDHLAATGVDASIGSVGDAYDCETGSRHQAVRLLFTTDPVVWVSLLLICCPPGRHHPVVPPGQAVTS